VQELVKENNGAKQSFLAAFYLMIFNFVKVAIRAYQIRYYQIFLTFESLTYVHADGFQKLRSAIG